MLPDETTTILNKSQVYTKVDKTVKIKLPNHKASRTEKSFCPAVATTDNQHYTMKIFDFSEKNNILKRIRFSDFAKLIAEPTEQPKLSNYHSNRSVTPIGSKLRYCNTLCQKPSQEFRKNFIVPNETGSNLMRKSEDRKIQSQIFEKICQFRAFE